MMDLGDVAELLGFMAAYDRRTTSRIDDDAWAALPVMATIDLTLAKEAVVLFHDQEPDPGGHSRYLDPQQFKRYVRIARERRQRVQAKANATRALPAGTPADPRPANFAAMIAEAAARYAKEKQP
jgi:hypothetical protein